MSITVDPFDGLPRGQFKLIAADPPWLFKSYAPPSADHQYRRDAASHYNTMNLTDIKALPVASLCAPACHLFLWTTGPHLPEALEVIRAWGFTYSGMGFTWVKLKRSIDTRQVRIVREFESDLHVGLGFTTRKNAEFCLLARRGGAKRISKKVREVILSPVRQHSRKPDEFYRRAVEYADGPYLELFGREQRDGWTAWGNDTNRFTNATQPPARVAA